MKADVDRGIGLLELIDPGGEVIKTGQIGRPTAGIEEIGQAIGSTAHWVLVPTQGTDNVCGPETRLRKRSKGGETAAEAIIGGRDRAAERRRVPVKVIVADSPGVGVQIAEANPPADEEVIERLEVDIGIPSNIPEGD